MDKKERVLTNIKYTKKAEDKINTIKMKPLLSGQGMGTLNILNQPKAFYTFSW
jgi:hypothetical protein